MTGKIYPQDKPGGGGRKVAGAKAKREAASFEALLQF